MNTWTLFIPELKRSMRVVGIIPPVATQFDVEAHGRYTVEVKSHKYVFDDNRLTMRLIVECVVVGE